MELALGSPSFGDGVVVSAIGGWGGVFSVFFFLLLLLPSLGIRIQSISISRNLTYGHQYF